MKILRRHISVSIVLATSMVVLMLFGLQLFITFVGQLNDIGVGQYHVWQAFQYSILTLPMSLYSFFPMAGLLGSLLGLGYLASHHELVVMRASGVSMLQIILSVLRIAFLMIIVVTLIGEFVAPLSMHLANNLKTNAESGGQVLSTVHGVWIRDGLRFIHIQSVLPEKRLEGIFQYQFDGTHRLTSASFAKSANIKNGQWWLHDVVYTNFQQEKTTSGQAKLEAWPIAVNPTLLAVSKVETDTITFPTLVRLIQYRKANGLTIERYMLKFWARILQPFATLIMIFLAIPFVFGPLRSVSMGLRILTGIIVGFAFYLLNQFFGPLSLVYQVPPLIGASLPSILFLSLGCFFIRRVQ